MTPSDVAAPACPRPYITAVSGLPRSGTSMMMRMLAAGGMPVLTDQVRVADEDNPQGYFELERVKRLKEDQAWLPEAMGKAVKIISFLLPELPASFPYKVIFLRRAMPELLASQRQMMLRRGEPADATGDARLAVAYEKHLANVAAWMQARAGFDVIYVEHRRVITEPLAVAEELNAFLGGGLDQEKMAAAVEPRLYRQRS